MKLNHTIENFREQLKKAIYDSSINSNIQEKILNKLAKRGYNLGTISGVFEGNVTLDSLSMMDVGVFALEIYNTMNIEYINPGIYLTDIELKIEDGIKKLYDRHMQDRNKRILNVVLIL